MCTGFQLLANEDSDVVACRTLDFSPMEPYLMAIPSGMHETGFVSESEMAKGVKQASWVNKYFYIGIHGTEDIKDGIIATCEATNEKGLRIGLYVCNNCAFSYVPERDTTLGAMAPVQAVRFLAGTAATIDEAVDAIKKIQLLLSGKALGRLKGAYVLSDATGREVIIEHRNIDGKGIINMTDLEKSDKFHVKTNLLREEQMQNIQDNYLPLFPSLKDGIPDLEDREMHDEYSRTSRDDLIPGGFSSENRFVRVAYFAEKARSVSKTVEEAVDNGFAILRAFQIPPAASSTRTISTSCFDFKNMQYFYNTYENPGLAKVPILKWAESINEPTWLSMLDLSKAEPRTILPNENSRGQTSHPSCCLIIFILFLLKSICW